MKINIKDLAVTRVKHIDKKIVLVEGTFDLFHIGHLAYIDKAKEFGDILVVGVNSDIRTKRIKGEHRPIIKQSNRVQLVANIKAVDYAFIMPRYYMNGLRPSFQVIRDLKPDFFITSDKGWLKGQDYCNKYMTKIVILKRIDKTSTSRIIKQVSALPVNN